jgi:tetratricopeptide (TPR) repeat protein
MTHFRPCIRLCGLVGLLLLGSVLLASAQDTQLGETSFPTSGAPEAHEAFMEGLLLLHSFEYVDARAAFQTAQDRDSTFAMAYWGEAMTHNHPLWYRQDAEAARQALDQLASTEDERLSHAPTDREKAYLRAVHTLYGEGAKQERDHAYRAAMAEVAEQFPEDLDAQAFHALSILGTSHGGRDTRLYMQAAAIVEEVFDANPQHPGAAHYLIHSYDDPVHAPLGLRAARVYADIAPAAAHALHMPAHIFSALGQWERAAELNTRSWQASVDRMERQGRSIAARSYHALWWLAYEQLQQGQHAAAEATLDTVHTAIQQRSDVGTHRAHFVRMRAAHLVETQDWAHPTTDIAVDPENLNLLDAATDAFAMGGRAVAQGNLNTAQRRHDTLRARLESAPNDNTTARATLMADQLRALIVQAQGDGENALAIMESAVQEAQALPLRYGPPRPVKPVHELYGDMLLDAGRPAMAQTQYRTALDRAPRRAWATRGWARAAEAAGDTETAQEARAQLQSIWSRADDAIQAAR